MSIWNPSFLAGRVIGPLALLAGGLAMVRPEGLPTHLDADTTLALGKALVVLALLLITGASWLTLPQGVRRRFFSRGPAQRVVIRIRKRR